MRFTRQNTEYQFDKENLLLFNQMFTTLTCDIEEENTAEHDRIADKIIMGDIISICDYCANYQLKGSGEDVYHYSACKCPKLSREERTFVMNGMTGICEYFERI